MKPTGALDGGVVYNLLQVRVFRDRQIQRWAAVADPHETLTQSPKPQTDPGLLCVVVRY